MAHGLCIGTGLQPNNIFSSLDIHLLKYMLEYKPKRNFSYLIFNYLNVTSDDLLLLLLSSVAAALQIHCSKSGDITPSHT